MQELTTTLLDAALPQGQRITERFSWAKQTLIAGIAAGKIRNVDFKDAKLALSNAIQIALEGVVSRFHEAHRGQAITLAIDVSSYIQFNQVNARKRGIKKHLDIPEVRAYDAYLNELAILCDAVECVKGFVVKGRRPSENPTPLDLTNTGTCPICRRQQKLTPERKMVHHGFTISSGGGNYYGMRLGRCFGCDYPPYELSNAGNVAYKTVVEGQKAKSVAYLVSLNAGEVATLSDLIQKRVNRQYIQETIVTKKGDLMWTRRLEAEIQKTEWEIKGAESEIERQQALIANWQIGLLPSGNS